MAPPPFFGLGVIVFYHIISRKRIITEYKKIFNYVTYLRIGVFFMSIFKEVEAWHTADGL